MKVKPFTPVLTSIEVLILYSLRDIIHRTVKCLSPIKRLRLIFFMLIPYPRAESFPRVPLLVFRHLKSLPRER